MERQTLAELHAEPGGSPWEVVLRGAKIAHTLMRDVEQKLLEDELSDVDRRRLEETLEFTFRIGKLAADAQSNSKFASAYAQNVEAQGKLVADAVTTMADLLLDALLPLPADHDPSYHDVLYRRHELWSWALEAGLASLRGETVPDPPAGRAPLVIESTRD